MAPLTTEQQAQLDSAMKYLRNAVIKANACLTDDNASPEVIMIHMNFVTSRINAVEKFVSSINRRNKNEDLFTPDEAEEASELVRDLQIKRADLLRQETERDKMQLAAAAATAALQRPNNSDPASSMQVVIKKPPLPPLPIPRFSGSVVDFSNFITIFDETVHKNDTLAPSQKLVYLQSFVDGEAKNLIGGILVTNDNYEVARQTLQSNYGHSSQTVSMMYDKLHSVQKAKNDPFSIRDTYNEVEQILQMLEHCGVNVNTDQYLRHEVLKKWPWPLIRQLVRSTDISLQRFREELKKEVELQIQLTQATGYVPHQQNQQQNSARNKPYGERPKSSGGGAPTSGVAPTGPNGRSRPPFGSAPTSGVAQVGPTSGVTHPAASSSTSSATSGADKTAAPAEQPAQRFSAHCPFCAEHHHAETCERYKTAQQRSEKLGNNRCKKCFRQTHEGTPCIRNMKCRYCPSWEHNRALCPVKYGETDAKYLFTTDQQKNDLPGLFMTLLTNVANPATEKHTGMRILLDPACNRTAMTETAAQKIGISTQGMMKRSAKGMGDRQVEPITENSVEVSFAIHNEPNIIIPVHLTSKIADDVPSYSVQQFRLQHQQYEKYYIPPNGEGCPIDIIIGSDRMLRFLTLQHSIFVHQGCQLMSTKFGWVIMAENDAADPQQVNRNLFTFFTNTEDVVKVMTDLDLVGMKNLDEPEAQYEERALQIFYKSIKYVDGRYEVHWPWRTYPPNLSENYGLAMGRLRALLKKLSDQPKLLEAYHQIIQDQLAEGVVEDVPKNESSASRVIHYIPHHAVVVLDKSTPVRLVYDASAKVGKAGSLNSCILKGSKWLNNTIGSIIRFRKDGKAVTADIRHAFHQISISPVDRDAVRFIWVYDPTKPPVGENVRILRFTRVAFGIVASPFLLYATIQHHLNNNQTPYTDTIRREMYADNLLASLKNETDMTDFYNVTKKIFGDMSMNITKWRSNDAELMKNIPKADQIAEEELSVLGISWQSTEDSMSLRQPRISHLEKSVPTKKVVLKVMASIFDPLGWVAPFILALRLFLRKLWKDKKTWDSPLEKEDLELWHRFTYEIATLHTVKLRRMYFSIECDAENQEMELHTFVDASAEAVGNVSYLRLSSMQPEISLVMAKTRLAPNSKLSIPRLEFYALALGVKVQTYIAEELHLKQKITRFIWSDSKCVLAWVASSKLLPVAVERHLIEIRKADIKQFRYVPSAMNPADITSRGALLSDLQQSNWLQGPQWLISAIDWPVHVDVTCNEENEDENSTLSTALFIQGQHKVEIEPPFSLDATTFSEWKKLLRRTAYCVWLLHHYLKKEILKVSTPIDYNLAKMLWIRWDQRQNGSQSEEILKSITHFKGVDLFVDSFGILRCKSRLEKSKLPWTAIEPIILVKNSYITQLIVLDIHERNYHVGTAHTLATLRKNYWLIHGRREVYKIIHTKCYKCKRFNAQPFVPPRTPPLPEFRITETSRPFENTGVDIFGPIYVFSEDDQNQKKVKRWVLLLTCLVVRAIHMEVLNGLDSIDIVRALRRFTSRRGTPSLMLSDNAPQFHLINGCIADLWKNFYESEETNRYFAENKIVWKFTPQHAPWMGGAYERLVQVVKNCFKRTYCEQTTSDKEFSTSIIEIEAVINNRPITYVDKNLTTPLLTPNDFLRVLYPAMPIDVHQRENQTLSTKQRLLEYWRASQESLNVFWQTWSEQYLLALREIKNRTAKNQRTAPKVGDVVLMIDPGQKRGYWRKAVIERLITSADSRVRSAQVRLNSNSRMIRPIVKLALLDLLDDLPIQQGQAASVASSAEGASELAEHTNSEEDVDSRVVVIAPNADPTQNI